MLPEEELVEEAPRPGIVDSIRSMVATLVQILHARLELITTELEEEMYRVASVLLWGAVAVFSSLLFVLMVSVTVIIAAGEQHRLLASIIMTLVFLVILVTSALVAKVRLTRTGGLMRATREELKRDRDALKSNTSPPPPAPEPASTGDPVPGPDA